MTLEDLSLGQTATGEKEAQTKKVTGQPMISVNISKLDLLQKLTGELVMSEAMVTQNPELDGVDLDGFRKAARQLHKIINDVQDTVMSMRLVSLSSTFSKMHRIVRDMSKSMGKDVTLEVIGAETEVDKSIIDHIVTPLSFLIENAITHGIETPDVRKRFGKTTKGTIILEAKNTGGDVLISIEDDGCGLSVDSILAKAKQRGMLRKPESEYTEKEIFQFITMPGFSDSQSENTMATVLQNIRFIDGSILIDSVEGRGTVFTVKIPLTLAIIDSMIIRLGNAKYTIPITAIRESFIASEENTFTDPDGNEMIMVRGVPYNIIRLSDFFSIDLEYVKLEDGIIVMIESNEQTVCLFADELLEEQQVVVKNLPKYIKKIPGLGGCTILGNGDISLIMDVSGFFDN